MKNLKETSIAATYIAAIKQEGWIIGPDEIETPYCTIFRAIAEFLAVKKNKETAVALTVKDIREETLAIAKVECHLPEGEDQAPNWSFEMSFNESDIDLTNTKVYSSNDLSFFEVLNKVSKNLYNLTYIDVVAANNLVTIAFKVLKKWLDENASADAPVSIGIEGYFEATVAVEGGEKVFSLVPDGATKTLIKDDSELA